MTFHNYRPPRLVAPGGPVSRAVRIMADANPDLARIRALRRQIAMRIEADIALLDALAGDPDFEPSFGCLPPGIADESEPSGDDEPYLAGSCTDLEGDTADREPSLGSLGGTAPGLGMSQGSWALGAQDDRENEHDGCEPGEDDEPSLCGLTVSDGGIGDDREHDDSDREPGPDDILGGRYSAAHETSKREMVCAARLGLDRIVGRRRGRQGIGNVRLIGKVVRL